MAQTSWMQPALQPNEAVLLPALERTVPLPGGHVERRPLFSLPEEAFIPVAEPKPAALPPARAAGSMAGRSVLRAAGVRAVPTHRCRCKR